MWTRDKKLEITRLLGVGIKDIKQLNVGDMGYANGWGEHWYGKRGWLNGEIEKYILKLCREQGIEFEYRGNGRGDNHYFNRQYNISYSVDSSG